MYTAKSFIHEKIVAENIFLYAFSGYDNISAIFDMDNVRLKTFIKNDTYTYQTCGTFEREK